MLALPRGRMSEHTEQMKRKQRTIRTWTAELLTRMEDEGRKGFPDCDQLCQLLSVLSTKEESLVDLDKGIEDETPAEELEAEIPNSPGPGPCRRRRFVLKDSLRRSKNLRECVSDASISSRRSLS